MPTRPNSMLNAPLDLESLALTVIRFTNQDVIHNLEGVISENRISHGLCPRQFTNVANDITETFSRPQICAPKGLNPIRGR